MEDDLKVSKGDWKKVKNGLLYEILKKKGYKINKWVILPAFLIPVLLIVYLGATQGWGEKWSVNCPRNSFNDCMNPFYTCDPLTTAWCPDIKIREKVCGEDPGFCSIAILKPGETYGHKKGALEQNFFSITILSVLLAYGINHVAYNSAEQRKKRKETWENDNRKK